MQYGKLRTNTDCHDWCWIVSLANPASSPWICDLGISNYALSVGPRPMFAADGTMLHCSIKSKVMDILEKMSNAETFGVTPPEIRQPDKRVAIINAMTDVQSMGKPEQRFVSSFRCVYTKKIWWIWWITHYGWQAGHSKITKVCNKAFAALWLFPCGISQHRHKKHSKCSTKETDIGSPSLIKEYLLIYLLIPYSYKERVNRIFDERIAGIF